MPDSYPDYPSNRQILDYMRCYEAHFGLGPYIRLNSRVTSVTNREGGGWLVSGEDIDGQFSQSADYLVVCSGHHREPVTPDVSADFTGEQLHAGRYKKADSFA